VRCALLIVAAALAGCAAVPPNPQAQAIRHTDNIAAATRDGYRVINKDGQTLFCPTGPAIGSHLIAGCLTEAQWEQRELWVWSGPDWTSGTGESGRSANSGSLAPYVGH